MWVLLFYRYKYVDVITILQVDEAQARICCNFTRMMLESVVDGSGVGVTVPVGYADAQVG